MPAPSMHRPAELPHRLHRIAAALVAAYVLVHLANHLVALRGIGAHIAFMRAVRQVSRVPAVEALLLLGVAVQAGSGLWMLVRRARSGERAAWGTIALGAMLAVLIVAAFSSAFYAVDLPPAYRATFS